MLTPLTDSETVESDNLIRVKELSATEAARRFSDVLDAVEHRASRSRSCVTAGPSRGSIPTATPNGKAVAEEL